MLLTALLVRKSGDTLAPSKASGKRRAASGGRGKRRTPCTARRSLPAARLSRLRIHLASARACVRRGAGTVRAHIRRLQRELLRLREDVERFLHLRIALQAKRVGGIEAVLRGDDFRLQGALDVVSIVRFLQ